MPIIYTQTGRRLLKKAKSLWVLPYRYDDTVEDYVLGQTVYDLSAIIGDSIVLEQQDGETETKINEFTGLPLVKNTTRGECKVTAQCLDLQNAVLKALFAAYTNANGAAAIRSDYEELYACFRIQFKDSSTPDVVMPKVLMNNRLLMEQMKSRGSQGNIGGTALSAQCAVVMTPPGGVAPGNLLPFTDPIRGEVLYEISTSVLFVPHTSNVLVLNHRDDIAGDRYYDEVLYNPPSSGDCCAHNRFVEDPEGGSVASTYTILAD